jgi:hypothetical protein
LDLRDVDSAQKIEVVTAAKITGQMSRHADVTSVLVTSIDSSAVPLRTLSCHHRL